MNDRANFDLWLITLDDKLDQLFSTLPEDVSGRLDYSPESLTVLEKWLIDTYITSNDLLNQDKYLLDKLSCYVGETIRKNTTRIWTIDLENRNRAYFGLPVLLRPGDPPECPMSMVTASISRKKGNYMEKLLRVLMKEEY
jgi:hypothetical protein